MNTGISIIICCYNSSTRIVKTLEHIINQKISIELNWEVIIVNNNSNDNTVETVKKYSKQFVQKGIELSILNENTPGLTFARECGINASKYDFLLFCDDDNWLNEQYVETAYVCMNDNNNIGVLGGYGISEPEIPFSHFILPYTDIYINGPQEEKAKTQHWVYGAGSIYRKDILKKLKKLGWSQITSDRIGAKLISGGDVELCYMIKLCGYEIVGNDKLLFKHFVPSKRLTLEYVLKLKFWLSYSYFLMFPYISILNNSKSIREAASKPYRFYTKQLVQTIKLYIFKRLKKDSNYLPLLVDIKTSWGFIYSYYLNFKKVEIQKKSYKKNIISL